MPGKKDRSYTVELTDTELLLALKSLGAQHEYLLSEALTAKLDRQTKQEDKFQKRADAIFALFKKFRSVLSQTAKEKDA